jgi:hypothetical protein
VRSLTAVVPSCLLACCGALAAGAPAHAAAPKPITGTLSQPGYTVVALSTNGRAKSVRARGRFALRPPANTVTLQLRAADGVYAGPIVVGRKGKRAIVGVRAGAKLGAVEVLEGYAKTSKSLPSRRVDSALTARASKGVPIGAGVFGLVRATPKRGSVPGDLDIDGIPDRLDIDDDGDKVLDKVDRSTRTRAAQSPGHQDPFDLASALGAVPLEFTANVNAGSTDEQIAAVLPRFGFISMSAPEGYAAELDCGGSPNPSPPPPLVGGLSYCSYGGTGHVDLPAPGNVFPECCDRDRDGYGTLEPIVRGPDFTSWGLDHGANASQIGTGDQYILRLTRNGQETQLTDTQQFIFATTPALAAYVDEAGKRTVIPYPVQEGGPGTDGNGLPVSDGPDADSDVEITASFWRPQRRPTSEQECAQPGPGCTEREWIDVGGLDHTAASREGQVKTNDAGWCTQGAFSSSDPSLAAGFGDPQGGGFRDLAPSRPADVANTFTYTLNLTRCLRAFDLGFPAGRTHGFHFEAFTPIQGGGSAGVDNTMALVFFTRR